MQGAGHVPDAAPRAHHRPAEAHSGRTAWRPPSLWPSRRAAAPVPPSLALSAAGGARCGGAQRLAPAQARPTHADTRNPAAQPTPHRCPCLLLPLLPLLSLLLALGGPLLFPAMWCSRVMAASARAGQAGASTICRRQARPVLSLSLPSHSSPSCPAPHFSSFFSAAAAARSALSTLRRSCSRARSALRNAVSAAFTAGAAGWQRCAR